MPTKPKAQHMAASGTKPDADLEGVSSSKHGRGNPPSDTAQSARDKQEKRKHPGSENALESSQDKNPIPPGSTRE